MKMIGHSPGRQFETRSGSGAISCAVAEEPDRGIIAEQRASGDGASGSAHVKHHDGCRLLVHGLVDAASAFEADRRAHPAITLYKHCYSPHVHGPAWPEHYETDADCKHDFAAALPASDRLIEASPAFG